MSRADLIDNARGLASLGMDKGYDELLYALSDALESLEEQFEVLDSALRDILDITEGWTPKMDLEVRLTRIDAYAKEALKAVKGTPNPASGSD